VIGERKTDTAYVRLFWRRGKLRARERVWSSSTKRDNVLREEKILPKQKV